MNKIILAFILLSVPGIAMADDDCFYHDPHGVCLLSNDTAKDVISHGGTIMIPVIIDGVDVFAPTQTDPTQIETKP